MSDPAVYDVILLLDEVSAANAGRGDAEAGHIANLVQSIRSRLLAAKVADAAQPRTLASPNPPPTSALDATEERALWLGVAMARLGRNGATADAAAKDADAILAAWRSTFGPKSEAT